jgi:hypothetical protein
MYVRDLSVRGVKLLKDFHLSFLNDDGTPRMWTVLLGENGRCKTSVLRAIAMAASGASRTHELADLPSLHDRREALDVWLNASFALPDEPARTYPTLTPGAPTPRFLSSTLEMSAGVTAMKGYSSYYTPGVLQTRPAGEVLFDIRGGNLPYWFVAGYGTNRMLPRQSVVETSTDPSVGRMASLFDRGTIVGTGFADLLADPGAYSKTLRDALIEHHVLPDDAAGIELRGRGGVKSAADLVDGNRFVLRSAGREMKVPAAWLSQGYQSTIAWVADLIGHAMLDVARPVELGEICGLVLIDEIDLHLHPAWQVRLIETLRTTLPNVQFVVTTHSPMILPGLRAGEIVMLELDDSGNVVPRTPDTSPMLLTGSEIYRSFFGIDRLYPTEVGREYERYKFLVGNAARSDEEDSEMMNIRSKLVSLGLDPGWEAVPRQSA